MSGNKSLTKTLVNYILLIGSTICLLTAFTGYQLLSNKSQKEHRVILDETLNYLEDSLELPLWYLDSDSLKKICDSLIENRVISFIKVFDDNSIPLLTIDTQRIPLLIEGEVTIYHQDKKVGLVQVGLSSSIYIDNNKNLLFFSIVMSLAVILGLALFTTLCLRALLKKPIDDLNERIDVITHQDYDTNFENLASEYSEISTILNKFNKMAFKVGEREKWLVEAKSILEQEVNEHVETAQALKKSENKYRELYENSPDMYVSVDASTSLIRECNQTLAEKLGYTKEEIIQQPIFDMYHPDCLEDVKKHFHIFKTGGRVENAELELRCKDGTKIDVILTAIPVKDKLGKILYSRSAWRDISALKQINKEKSILEQQLQQSQKMESIGTLAGGIAHEFNNMLAIIMGNNELIMEELPQGSLAKESSAEIRIAGLRARDVVKQLLTFSRQDGAAKKVMDFTSVVQESIKLIRSSTPVNIQIEQNLLAETYTVMCNDTQINQLLINLCNNAVDALPNTGGTITIELLSETIDDQQTKHQTKLNPGQYAKLIVSDNGIGMDNEILDRIFEPYFTTKDIGEGTGIGMAVVHGIVERHGGAIFVESKLGRGTTFTILLPAHEGLLGRETDEVDILPVGDEYILYVDDEPSIATLGKRLLESLGYTTESTTDPEKALDMVRTNPNKFDLLITDMAMPNMTGDQLIIEILKIRQDMPTIICTGYSAKISEKDAADIGAKSFVMKPINKLELAKTVRNVLDDAKGPVLPKH